MDSLNTLRHIIILLAPSLGQWYASLLFASSATEFHGFGMDIDTLSAHLILAFGQFLHVQHQHHHLA